MPDYDMKDVIKENYNVARRALEAKGLVVEMVFFPRQLPTWPHPTLHLHAFKEYPVGKNGNIPTAQQTFYSANMACTGQLGAIALATWLLEEWADLYDVLTTGVGK